jgi:hypothetical protein
VGLLADGLRCVARENVRVVRLTRTCSPWTTRIVSPRVLLVLAFLTMALACTRGATPTTGAPPPPAEPTEAGPSVTGPLPVAPPPVDPRLDASPNATGCGGVRLEGAVIALGENRAVSLSGAQVTAGPILMRWVMQDSGVSEHTSSARLATKAGDPGTTVRVGTLVPVGADRYCVVDIKYYGGSEPSVSLQKVAR